MTHEMTTAAHRAHRPSHRRGRRHCPAASTLACAVAATAVLLPGGAAFAQANSDRDALVALYNATGGDNWTNNDDWLTEAPLNEWYGVTTDNSGRVTGLDLDGELVTLYGLGNNLTGAIPVALGDLTSLKELSLSGNSLTRTIPGSLGNLSNLEILTISRNNLTGTIPSSLGNLNNLTWLSLSDNSLTGTIPSSLGNLNNLTWLSLSDSSADDVSALYRTTYSVVRVSFPRMILLQPAVDHDALYKVARAKRAGAGG